MKKVTGLLTPHNILEIGNQAETLELFNYVKENYNHLKWLIKLFHKYIDYNELKHLLDDINHIIEQTPSDEIKKIFTKIKNNIISSNLLVDNLIKEGIYKEYHPLMIVISDLPELILQKNIPLSFRDALKGEDDPLWLNPPIYQEIWFK